MATILRKGKRLLPCILTEDEMVERQETLVTKTKERELRENSLKTWKATKADEQKSYEADISHVARECFRLAGIIESGNEPRDVEVEEVLGDAGSDVTVTTYRTDTGEVVSQRVASSDELQRRLEFTEAREAAAADAVDTETQPSANPQVEPEPEEEA